jgi:hypothetical protein
MYSNAIANNTLFSYFAPGTDDNVVPDACVFSHNRAMTGLKLLAYSRSGIDHAVRSYHRMVPYPR